MKNILNVLIRPQFLALSALTLVLQTSAPALAQTGVKPVEPKAPLCNEDMSVVPCTLSTKDAGMAVTDMLIGNPEAYKLIRNKTEAQRKGRSGGYNLEGVRVTMVSQETRPHGSGGPRFLFTTRYEILLNDCRGTDACSGSYLLTVEAKETGDGYCSEEEFSNKFEKSSVDELDPENERD